MYIKVIGFFSSTKKITPRRPKNINKTPISMDVFNNRTFLIKNAIEWKKFTSGAI